MAWQGMQDAATSDYQGDARVKSLPSLQTGLDALYNTMQSVEGLASGMHRRVCGQRPESVEKTESPTNDNYAARVEAIQRMAQRIMHKLREIGEQV